MNTYRHPIPSSISYEPTIKKASASASTGSTPGAILKTIGRALVNFLTHGSDLRIWQTTDCSGLPLWHVYDPSSGTTARMHTETDVRIWIEQRYSCGA